MIFSTIVAATTLLLSALPSLAYYPQGYITVPTNGSQVEPGQAFNFTYNVHSDYCLTSHNFTVWVLTTPPTSVMQIANDGVQGAYLGRYSASGFSNEFPSNPTPPQLVMPDFSQSQGGFSEGAYASDLPVYLAVIEEFNECGPALGSNFSVAFNTLIYNATTSA